jgi:hypothetical protein
MKTILLNVVFLLFLLAGCRQSELKEFEFSFTIENISSYKITLDIDYEKNYSIQEQNIFFDLQEKRENIKTHTGKLTNDEWAEFKTLISRSRLFNMKDSYGFEHNPNPSDPLSNLIYQINYTVDGKTKYISIRPNDTNKYSGNFLKFITYLNKFISLHRS